MDNPDKLDQPMSKQWHYHPKLPVGFYPFFEWPPQPKNWLNFIWHLSEIHRQTVTQIYFFMPELIGQIGFLIIRRQCP